MTDRIVISPDICNGRPVIRGTRITAQTVLEFLATGDSIEDVLQEYPTLTRADVQACLDYAARVIPPHATPGDALLPKLLSGELRVAKAVISPAIE
jgi:uncharacterized protein (DUF433 family)